MMKPARYLRAVIALLVTTLVSSQLLAESFSFAPAYELGNQFPVATLSNQDGEPRQLGRSDATGWQLIAFNRSVVW